MGERDEEVVGVGGGVGRTVGFTALVAVVGGEELVVANYGDCRAVLFSGGVALALSRDHKVRFFFEYLILNVIALSCRQSVLVFDFFLVCLVFFFKKRYLKVRFLA